MPPKTWLNQSILATLLCMPLGLVAITYSSRVESYWLKGCKEKAAAYSRNARIWTIVAFVVGCVALIAMMIPGLIYLYLGLKMVQTF